MASNVNSNKTVKTKSAPKTGYDALMASPGAPVDGGYGTQSEVSGQGGGAGGSNFSTTPGNVALGGFGRGVVKQKFNTPASLTLPKSTNNAKVKGIKNQVSTYHNTRGKVGF